MGNKEKPITWDGPVADFATRLRAVRAEVGLTFRQMARRSNYTYTVFSAASGGVKLPSWDVTREYLKACGVDEGEFHTWQAQWAAARSHIMPGQEIEAKRLAVAMVQQTRPNPELVETYADLLRELRLLRIMAGDPSLSELSVKARSWSRSSLSDLFSGRHRTTASRFQEVADCLLSRTTDDVDLVESHRIRWREAWLRAGSPRETGAFERSGQSIKSPFVPYGSKPKAPALSVQELRAFRLWISGKKMAAVAREMNISRETVHQYLLRVRMKYSSVGRRVTDKASLTARAIEDGLIRPEDVG